MSDAATPTDLLSDPRAVKGLIAKIGEAARAASKPITIMEVCGTHTHAVAAAGLRRMLPGRVRLISGPGCPVCVTPVGYLDRALALAARPGVTICTFGDLMRVPSSTRTLEHARADGLAVRIVYSPRDALDLARSEPGRQVIFLAVGFETTAPTIAAALAEAETDGVANFLILPGHKVMPPPMKALVDDPEIGVTGFLLPGHVSVLTGWEVFRFLAEDHHVPGAVVGFAPADVLRGVLEIIEQSNRGEAHVVNLYNRVVSPTGNAVAAALVERFFEPADAEWRGFGVIPGSGLALRPAFAHRDAGFIEVELPAPREPVGCRCGEVLRGVVDPPECPLFGGECIPDNPVGACMVSAEGSCAAWYRHERWADAV